MTPAAHPQLSGLFERAINVPLEGRAEFLDAACGRDAGLRRELESLLVAHDSASDYFDRIAVKLGLSPVCEMDAPVPANAALLATLQSDLAATYRIERELGGGGMSRVFLAEEIALGRRVVIKTLPPEMAATVSIDRFRREIALIAQLQHPHIVPLLSASASGALLYYTMPFVAGESLRNRLVTGALPLDDALRIWRDMLEALAHAHANAVVHRDIKPANILLSGRSAMVTDFGIARAIEAATTEVHATLTGPIGTPAYMAPEQATATGAVDHRADLYAAGLVMYEMLAGRAPFQASSAREFVAAHMGRVPEPLRRADVPPRLVSLVMQCLSKDPAARPTSADAILAELDNVSARPMWSMAALRRPHVLLYGLAAIAVVAVLALVIGDWLSRGSTAPRETRVTRRHVVPDTAMRLYQRGLAEQRRRTLEGAGDAMVLFDRAIAADSEFSLAWAAHARNALFSSARSWTVHGRSPDSLLAFAVRTSRRALELDSSSAEAWTVAGKVAGAVDVEDRAATLNMVRRALALDSTYAQAWFDLGQAYEESLQPAEAERAWLRAVALNPTNTQALSFLGFHYLWYDDYAKGVRWADSAIAVDPTYFLARDAAAELALATRRPAVALRHAEAVQRTRGHEPALPFCLLAEATVRLGDTVRARQYALSAESLIGKREPSAHEAIYIGGAWAAIGDTARALRWVSARAREKRADLHYQLHLKRDPNLRWIAKTRPSLLTP